MPDTDPKATNPTDAERADAMLDVLNYAIKQDDIDAREWLRAWREGDPEAMDELDNWRKQHG